MVVEVAPNVVDATAVALPGPPHVITDAVESDVPVFDPLDSDEEDELHTLFTECKKRLTCWPCRSSRSHPGGQ